MRPDQDVVSSTDVDRALFASFTRTWEESARLCPLPREDVERRVVELFRLLCVRLAPAVVLELGAHEATFSRWAAGALPRARVLAFEANPHVHAKYADVVTAAGVDYRNLAVAPTTGPVTLHLPRQVGRKQRSRTSRMASLAMHVQATDTEQVEVPGVRLDDHVRLAEGERAVAWVDVEGANELVLRSGPEVLDRTDAVYVEVEKEPRWEDQWLDTDVALHLQRHGLVPVARDLSPRPHQYNLLLVRDRLVLDDPFVTAQAARVLRKRRLGDAQD